MTTTSEVDRLLDQVLVVLAAAVVGLLVFGAVAVLAANGPDPHAVAADALAADGAEQVAAALPDDAVALVRHRDTLFEVSTMDRPQRTPQSPDVLVAWLASRPGGTAVARGDDGSWAAVAVPERRSPVLAGLVAGLLALAGVLVVRQLATRRSPDRDDTAPGEHRATLILNLVKLLPQLPDGLKWQAGNALTAVGVRELTPDGERFDPRRHHVVGTEAPADPARVNTIARTIRPGYADGDHVVVHPKVVVYSMEAGPR